MIECCIIAPGIITPPYAAELLPWLLPVWAVVVMLALWRWTNRDRGPVVTCPTLYEPPAGLTPAEIATLVDKQVLSRDIAATMVDLAVRGYIRIAPRDQMLLGHNVKDYALTLLKSRTTWDSALAGHELEVLDTLFPLDSMVDGVTNSETTLSFAAGQFGQAIPIVRKEIYRELRAKGLVGGRGASWIFGMVALCLVLIVLPLGLLTQADGRSVFLALKISMGIVVIFLARLAPMTVRGTQARAACLSFRDFIERVDGDRLRRLPPERFEKLLPYAMAFGFEKRWTEAFHELVPGTMDVNLPPAKQSTPNYYTSVIPLDDFSEAVHFSVAGR